MKNGFTLVELLAVIVIIAIIAVIGIGGLGRVNKNINVEMCNSTIKMIETGGAHYGEDFKNLLNTSCVIDGVTYQKCTTVKVSKLIGLGYINVKEIEIKDENDEVIATKKELVNETNGEVLDNKDVNVYIDNDIVYAKLLNVKCE